MNSNRQNFVLYPSVLSSSLFEVVARRKDRALRIDDDHPVPRAGRDVLQLRLQHARVSATFSAPYSGDLKCREHF